MLPFKVKPRPVSPRWPPRSPDNGNALHNTTSAQPHGTRFCHLDISSYSSSICMNRKPSSSRGSPAGSTFPPEFLNAAHGTISQLPGPTRRLNVLLDLFLSSCSLHVSLFLQPPFLLTHTPKPPSPPSGPGSDFGDHEGGKQGFMRMKTYRK